MRDRTAAGQWRPRTDGELVEEVVVLVGRLRPRRAVFVGNGAAEVAQGLLQLHLLGVVLAVFQLVSQVVEVFLPVDTRQAAGG